MNTPALFAWASTVDPAIPKVDTKARICVLQSFYSVPVRLARRRVPVRLGARHLEVLDPTSGAIVAVHARSAHKGSQDLQLDHYWRSSPASPRQAFTVASQSAT